jgi:hypothetical protein
VSGPGTSPFMDGCPWSAAWWYPRTLVAQTATTMASFEHAASWHHATALPCWASGSGVAVQEQANWTSSHEARERAEDAGGR